jgi:hypothetical protein
LVDVEPQNRGKRLDCAREEFDLSTAMRKRGRTDEQIVPVRLLRQAVMGVSNHSFDRQRSIESVGRIVEDQDGVVGVDWSLAYARMAK